MLPTAAPRRGQRTLGLLLVAALLTGACSPYPDDGEFLAGVVFAANFITGVKQLDMLPAVGRGQGVGSFAPYTVIATTQGMNSPNPVTSTAVATSPLWTDGKRKPLDRKSAQPVYVLDSACVAPVDYRFDPVHSKLVFFADHMGFSTAIGRFARWQGEFTYDPDDASANHVDVSIDIGSLDAVRPAVDALTAALAALSASIDARERTAPPRRGYPYLHPSLVTNSVNI